ncbi:hypothetical protein BGX28_004789 [Mortierella sp. GBA30]|nr:hypothetical protein BGX28_004789 [Mortierella sp. GBA30]
MKFSLFHIFTLLACVLAVLCVRADAKKSSVVCDPSLKLFCDKSTAQLDLMLEQVFETIPFEEPGKQMGTTASRRRQVQGLARRSSIFVEIKEYFTNYWHNLKLIFSGHFGEGIFNQLKNSGSWCEKDNWIVKAVKAAINSMSGGALVGICDCLYPMISKYDTYQQLFGDITSKGFGEILDRCPANIRKQLTDTIKKTGEGLIKKGKHDAPKQDAPKHDAPKPKSE